MMNRQLYKKEWAKRNSDKIRKYNLKWRELNKDRYTDQQKIALKNRRQNRLEKKLCFFCGDANICNLKNMHTGENSKELLCKICYLKNMAKRHLDSMKKWEELDGIYEKQGGRCFYTGVKIDIGKNASIDHRVSRSMNGENNIKNLNWVSYEINFMKRGLSEERFLELCGKVAKNTARTAH